MALKINRHSRIISPYYKRFLKNNVKFDKKVKKLKAAVRLHNYKYLNFPAWKVKVLTKLGRKYIHKFKKPFHKRKFFKRVEGCFYYILKGLSLKNFVDTYILKNFHTIWDDYENSFINGRNSLFFYKLGLKAFVNSNRRIKYFRRKIVIRKIFAKKIGINSHVKLYHYHKNFRNKRQTILRWINAYETRLENFIFNLGWARTVENARFLIWDSGILVNGSKNNNNLFKSFLRRGDNLCLLNKFFLYKLKRRRFFRRLFASNFLFYDWYLQFNKVFFKYETMYWGILRNNYKNFYNSFATVKTFESKILLNNKFLNFFDFRKNLNLLEVSNKKVSVSLVEQFNFYNFLSLYKVKPIATRKKLVDFFLHSNYF